VRTLLSAGLHVPDDVAVTGFNNYPWAATTEIPLTTIAPGPWDELGARAARLVLDRIERPGGEPRREPSRSTAPFARRKRALWKQVCHDNRNESEHRSFHVDYGAPWQGQPE